MEPEYVSKWQPGAPEYKAALPAPLVHYLSGHDPECRLIALFYPAIRDPYVLDCKQPYVKRRLHLDYSPGPDPLGNPYWRDLDELTEEDRAEVCQTDCPSLKVCRSLMHQLATALGIPTAEEVEAGLKWEKIPDIEFPPEEA